MSVCRSGCKTKDHASYADCLTAANAGLSMGTQYRSRTERELSNYRDARRQGIQPAGTTQRTIDAAHAMSDKFGGAFDASAGTVAGKSPAEIKMGV